MSKIDMILSAAAQREKALRKPEPPVRQSGNLIRLLLVSLCFSLAALVILSQPQTQAMMGLTIATR